MITSFTRPYPALQYNRSPRCSHFTHRYRLRQHSPRATGSIAEVVAVDALWLVIIGSSLAASAFLFLSFLNAKKEVDRRRDTNNKDTI